MKLWPIEDVANRSCYIRKDHMYAIAFVIAVVEDWMEREVFIITTWPSCDEWLTCLTAVVNMTKKRGRILVAGVTGVSITNCNNTKDIHIITESERIAYVAAAGFLSHYHNGP